MRSHWTYLAVFIVGLFVLEASAQSNSPQCFAFSKHASPECSVVLPKTLFTKPQRVGWLSKTRWCAKRSMQMLDDRNGFMFQIPKALKAPKGATTTVTVTAITFKGSTNRKGTKVRKRCGHTAAAFKGKATVYGVIKGRSVSFRGK